MAVIRVSYPWTPELKETAAKLSVKEQDMAAFEKALKIADAAFHPYLLLRQLSIDAIGDDFVMLSGEWLEDSRLAKRMAQAKSAWVFYASAGTVALDLPWGSALASAAACDVLAKHVLKMRKIESTQMDAIATGDTQALLRLLGRPEAEEAETKIGILFTEPRLSSACGGCGGCGGCSSHCAGCHARNTNE